MPNHKLPILSCVASANTPLAKTNAQRQRGREGHGKDALWENEDLDWLNLAHPPRQQVFLRVLSHRVRVGTQPSISTSPA